MFSNVYESFTHKIQSRLNILDHFHLSLYKDKELSTLVYLHPTLHTSLTSCALWLPHA